MSPSRGEYAQLRVHFIIIFNLLNLFIYWFIDWFIVKRNLDMMIAALEI